MTTAAILGFLVGVVLAFYVLYCVRSSLND